MADAASVGAAGIVEAFFDRHRVGGAVVGIVSGGELAWVHTHGYEELEAGPPVEAGTVFRIASITKTFTAAATMLLTDAGAVSLEEPAISWLPELAVLDGPTEEITIERLLAHRAGLPRESPSFDWSAARFPTVGQILAEADRIRLAGAPGGEPRYSNLGYQLVGEIVARAAGAPFEDVVAGRLLEPLGLARTGFVPAGEAARRLARGYEARVFSDHLPPADERPKATSADGGLWATVGDVARWALVHLHGDQRVLPKELLAELHRPRWDGDGPRPALGWYRTGDDADPRLGHSGGTFGFSGRLELAPAHDLAAVVLVAGSAPAGELAGRLLGHAIAHGPPSGTSGSARPRPAPIPTDRAGLLGLYAWEDLSLPVQVEWRDGGLAIVRSWEDGGAAAALEPTDDPLAFVVRGGRAAGELLRFRRGSHGRISGFTIGGWPFVRLVAEAD
jgi:CubicO group peptidase (beta-lactamase class C family)